MARGESMLILASQSPRRYELLQRLGFPFKVHVADIDEMSNRPAKIEDIPLDLATRKATKISQQFPQDVVIGADTIVVLNDLVLDKPLDANDARRMLKLLSGKTHRVLTGVCIRSPLGETRFVSETKVTFMALTESDMNRYIETLEWTDKAGAYGIQNQGALLVESIHGDYFTVVGLPIAQLYRALLPHMPKPK